MSNSLLLIVLLSLFSLQAAGQISPREQVAPSIQSNASLVLVPVSVTDRNGATVNGLDVKDFTVFEDKAPQPIIALSSEDAPSSVGIVFDISGSMRDKTDLAKTALRAFVGSANPEDEAFLLAVSTRPEVFSGFTSDLATLAGAVQFLKSGGSTALIDTVFEALDRMRSASRQRRALLILSDGMDNHSRHSQGELTRRAM